MKESKLEKQVRANRQKSMSKKALAEYNKTQRTVVTMNTSTQTHKSVKDYDRKREKDNLRKILKNL